MDAVITAGGIPQPGEPLYEYTQGISKAMLDIQGRPMVQWVIDALEGAPSVERMVIVGLDKSDNLSGSKIAAYLPNQGGMIENARAGITHIMQLNPQVRHVLYVSSDIPTITAEMVDWVVKTSQETDHDAYYNVITKEVMEKRFPGSKRSYVHLRGMEVCGGDLNVLRAQTVAGNEELMQRLVDSRKNALKQAALVGYDTAILLLLRVLSLERAARIAAKRLGIKARPMVCPYAEIGMDVDKPHQLELVRADMARVKV
jgi:GTP:adenosylcobinamide-phosphate guanylyltransferase